MGRQIGFYMSRDDEIEFIDFIRTTGKVVIVAETSDSKLKEQFQYFYELEGRDYGDGCHLWNQEISLAPTVNYFPEQGYYCIDSMQAEVLNPCRSKMTDLGLSMGRIHVDDYYLSEENTTTLPKSQAFLEWYEQICQWIRSRHVSKVNGAYVLPGAAAMVDEDVDLTGHSF